MGLTAKAPEAPKARATMLIASINQIFFAVFIPSPPLLSD